MTYFLLVYDRSRGQLIRPLRTFAQADGSEAFAERFALEREFRGQDVEIVVLGSDSEQTIRSTHCRYFSPKSDLLDGLETATGVAAG